MDVKLVYMLFVMIMVLRISSRFTTFHSDLKADANPCSFTFYRQCDARWGQLHLGTSRYTICAEGCALTSASMIVATWNNDSYWNPLTLNEYLNNNNGFYKKEYVNWTALDNLNAYYQYTNFVSKQDLINGLKLCNGYVASVRNGSHVVLLTGYAGNNLFYVNDPYFNDTTYDYNTFGIIDVLFQTPANQTNTYD